MKTREEIEDRIALLNTFIKETAALLSSPVDEGGPEDAEEREAIAHTIIQALQKVQALTWALEP